MNDTSPEKVLVGSSEPDVTNQSRRRFLKVAGLTTLAALVEACGGNVSNYRSLENGDVINLQIGSNPESGLVAVSVRYHEDRVRHLVMRKSGPIGFTHKAERSRVFGEISDTSLYPIGINPDLPKGQNVRVYESPGAPGGRAEQTYDLSEAEHFYGIPVITYPQDGMADGNQRFEINSVPTPSGNTPVEKFGNGYAVGKLEEGSGRPILKVFGYVLDARVFVKR